MKMSYPKISIIIPAYNCGKYIEKCIKSVLSQSYLNIEVIIIDDGSDDNTYLICEKLAAKDRRIVLIHQINCGVSYARNVGLNHSTGDYITFVDSDDYVDSDMIGNYIPYILNFPESICISGYRHVNLDGKILSEYQSEYKEIDLYEALLILYRDDENSFRNYLWNKLYPRALFENIHFTEGRTFEDVDIQYRLFEIANKIILCPFVSYNYTARKNSLTHIPQKYFDFVDAQTDRFIYANNKIPVHLQLLAARLFSCYMECSHIAKLLMLKNRDVIRYRYNTEIKIKNILYILKKYIPYHKYLLINISVRSSFVTDTFIEVVVIINKVLNKLYIKNIYRRLSILLGWSETPLTDKQYDKAEYNVEYSENENNIIGYDRERKRVLVHSYSSFNKSFLARSCPALNIIYGKQLKHKNNNLAQYEYYEWIVCDVDCADSLSAPGAVFILGKKKYRDAVPVFAVKRFFRNKLNALPWCRTDGSWIFMDRDTQADDNAEHLYRWLRRHHPERKIFFALRRTSHDWERLEREGFALLDITSGTYLWRRLRASAVISSHADGYIFYPASNIHSSVLYKEITKFINRIFRFIKKDCVHIFLQHGVTMNNIASWLNKQPISLIITETPSENAAITGNGCGFRYAEEEVAFTGFPRHDSLVGDVGTQPACPQITFMPTWRLYLSGESLASNTRLVRPGFMQSTYARHWQKLLSGDGLRLLWQTYGFRIVFFPHVNIQPYLSLFNLPNYVQVLSHAEAQIQDIFRASSLLVTDYSSVAFEMAFLMRPVIYYQFDEHEFFSGKHVLTAGYFDYEEEGFGPVVRSEEQLLKEIEMTINRKYSPNAIYTERMKNAIVYRDGNSCARAYDAINRSHHIVLAGSL